MQGVKNWRAKLARLAWKVVDHFFFRECVLCGVPIPPSRGWICRSCMAGAQWKKETFHGHDVFHLTATRGETPELVWLIKEERESLTEQLASLTAPMMRRRVLRGDEVVTWPPGASGQRGVEYLAASIASRCGTRFERLIKRRRETNKIQMKRLTATERRRMAADIFMLRIPAGALEGRHVVLVDDLMTTGSTFLSCAKLLREKGGASRVTGVFMAKILSTSELKKSNVHKRGASTIRL